MKRLKESRSAGFVIIGLVYLLATVLGLWIYQILDTGVWLRILIADVAATVFTFIFSLIFTNASVYDPYWSVQPIVIVFAIAPWGSLTAAQIMILAAIGFWGVRLTANWAYTFHGLKHQDWRYTMLHDKTGAFYPFINFIGIHMVPTLVVYACTMPAVYAMLYAPVTNAGGIIFPCLSILAASWQGLADIQMHRYRKNKTSPFIQTGLWKYSRHPNYLGEVMMWWCIGLAAVCLMPEIWYLLLIGALANTILFLSVSIPMADGRQSKKEGFAEYKSHTRMLLPIRRFK